MRSVPASPTSVVSAPAAGQGNGGWRPRPVTVAVLVIGLCLTGLLAWSARTADERSSASLLALQTRQTASTLSASLPVLQGKLGDALSVALATDAPATFHSFASNTSSPAQFISESLWRESAGRYQMVSIVGEPPLLASTGAVAGFFAGLQPKAPLHLTSILPGSPPRLGMALYDPGDPRYAVYAEANLPSSRRIKISPSSPFSQLNFAFYLGRKELPSQLIEATVPTPISTTHHTVSVPFGDSGLTVVATPKDPLTPWLSRALPWIAVAFGVVLSLAAAVVIEYLGRRRRAADQLSAALGRLYAEQRSIAETIQHSFLPQRLPPIGGMDIGVRYAPGMAGAEIGGDWYDVVEVGPGRFVFIIGDVSGRGIRAGTVMASLRFASRAFALEGHAPGEILAQLGKTLDFKVDGHFATVLCGLVDVARHEVVLANAGHLPPILRTDGAATVLDVPPAPPIGIAGGGTVDEVPFLFASGSTLIAYTDGLVERRGLSLDTAIDHLRDAAETEMPSLEDLLSNILSNFTEETPDDDVALMGLQWQG